MKRLVLAAAFAFSVSTATLAGDIPTVPGPTPSANDQTESVSLAAREDIRSDGDGEDCFTEMTLSVFQSVLSLVSV